MSSNNETQVPPLVYTVEPSTDANSWQVYDDKGTALPQGQIIDCIQLATTNTGTQAAVDFALTESATATWEQLSMTNLEAEAPVDVELSGFGIESSQDGFEMVFINEKGTSLQSGELIEDFCFTAKNKADGNVYTSADPRLGTTPPPPN